MKDTQVYKNPCLSKIGKPPTPYLHGGCLKPPLQRSWLRLLVLHYGKPFSAKSQKGAGSICPERMTGERSDGVNS